jgi:hypothetical protein
MIVIKEPPEKIFERRQAAHPPHSFERQFQRHSSTENSRLGKLGDMEGTPFTSTPYSMATRDVARIVFGTVLRRRRLSLVPIALVGLACCAVGMLQHDPISFVLAAATLLLPAILALRIYFTCRGQSRLNNAERTTTFGTDGMHETDSFGNDFNLAWATFLSGEERPAYWLLNLTKQKFVIVPKQAFAGSQVAGISELLRSKGLLKP